MKRIALLLSLLCCQSAFAEEDAALVSALTSFNWTWQDIVGGPKHLEAVQFYANGLAKCDPFWTGRWSVAGPHLLVIENTHRNDELQGRKAYLVFDADISHYTGYDFNGRTTIEGLRREALDPERKPAADDPDPAPHAQDFESGAKQLGDVSAPALERFLQDLNRRKDYDATVHGAQPGPDAAYLLKWLSVTMGELTRRGYYKDPAGELHRPGMVILR